MKKFKIILKTNSAKIILVAIIILLASYGLTHAGSLTPSATPAATMQTLGDIYNKIQNFAFNPSSHSLSTTTTPASSSRSLTEIWNLLAGQTDLTAGNIKSGATILGIAGSYSAAGNATVPGNAPILPAQAFVDHISKFTRGDTSSVTINDATVTHIDPALVGVFDQISGQYSETNIDFSGSALPLNDVNGVLSQLVANGNSDGSLNLSGGTNATPTNGATNANAWTLADNSWTISFNLHSHVVQIDGGNNSADFSGNSMSQSEVNSLLSFLAANYLNLGWTLNLSGGTNATPTIDTPATNASYTFTFASPTEDSNPYFNSTMVTPNIWIIGGANASQPLANSSISDFTSGIRFIGINMGISDSPTDAQIATKAAQLVNGSFPISGFSATSSGSSLTITCSNESLLPFNLQDEGDSSLHLVENNAGVPSHNAARQNLEDHGWTVTTN